MVPAPAPSYPDLPDDQMLAIAVYGEQVAAYRYTVLAERVPGEPDRQMFAEIAKEEQSHRQRIQRLLDRFLAGCVRGVPLLPEKLRGAQE